MSLGSHFNELRLELASVMQALRLVLDMVVVAIAIDTVDLAGWSPGVPKTCTPKKDRPNLEALVSSLFEMGRGA